MKTIILTLLLVTNVSALALAADKTDGKSGSLAVEKIICNKVSYVPAAGLQSPDYQAGVDVNGKSVVSADLNSVPNMLPDYIEVPMTIDLAKKMNLPQVGAEAEMPVANLKIYKNGKFEYNGQDISSNAGTLCGVAQKSKAEDMQRIAPAAGQDQMLSAPSTTITQDSANNYQPDMVAPDEFKSVAGSVAASTTSPAPKVEYQVQKETVNRAPLPAPLR